MPENENKASRQPGVEVGLECPQCGCRHFRVLYVRPRRGYIVRRRECRYCGHRVVTREQIGA